MREPEVKREKSESGPEKLAEMKEKIAFVPQCSMRDGRGGEAIQASRVNARQMKIKCRGKLGEKKKGGGEAGARPGRAESNV